MLSRQAAAAAGGPRATRLAIASNQLRRIASQASASSSSSGPTSTQTASPSTDSSSTHQQGSKSSSSSPPDAATIILLDSLPQIPQYGFMKQAYLRTSSSFSIVDPEEASKRLRVIDTLFPGPPTLFETALFTAWNTISDLATIHDIPTERVIETLRSGSPLTNGAEVTGKPVRMQQSLSKSEEKQALEKVTELIESRLRHSWSIRSHLESGLTSLSTASPTTSTLHSIFPHQTILPNLPNPGPFFSLSRTFVEAALTDPIAQKKTGWIDADDSDWYAVRARLTAAYAMVTLHMASGKTAHFQDSQALLRRIVRGRETGLVATVQGLRQSGGEWVKWGGRGWLGVFRSLGL